MSATFDWAILDDPVLGPIVKRVVAKVARSRPHLDPEEIGQEARIVAVQHSLEFRQWASTGDLGLVYRTLHRRLLDRLRPEAKYTSMVVLQAFAEGDEQPDDGRVFDDLAVTGFRGGIE